MMKLYFTFGSDPRFPFSRDEYVVVYGETPKDCIHKFMEKHPNPRPGGEHVVNCSFYYSEATWQKYCAHYYGPEPVEVIE